MTQDSDESLSSTSHRQLPATRQTESAMAGGVLILCLAGFITMGLLSGAAIVLAVVMVLRARSRDRLSSRVAWGCLVLSIVAWIGATALWGWIWWDDYRHPGAGGPFPPPTAWDTLSVPVLGLVASAVICLLGVLLMSAARSGQRRSHE